jgi:hypothetical protein
MEDLPGPPLVDYPAEALATGSGDSTAVERVWTYWEGDISRNWHTPGNWSLNAVPTSTVDVFIGDFPSVQCPVISSNASCHSLSVAGTSASITIEAAMLNVSTNYETFGELRMINTSADITVGGDLLFRSGSSLTAISAINDIIVLGNVQFYPGSNVNSTYGRFAFQGNGDSYFITQAPTSIGAWYSMKNSPYISGISSLSTQTLTINGLVHVYAGSRITHPYTGATILNSSLYCVSGGSCTFEQGTLVMQGNSNQLLSFEEPGSFLHNLTINKAAGNSVQLDYPIIVNGDLTIDSGILMSLSQSITLSGDWQNNVGVDGFVEAYGSVIFSGSGDQYVSSENFYILVDDNRAGLIQMGDSDVYCASYDWNYGGYSVGGGSFTAMDLAENGIFGTIILGSGSIEYHQDATQQVDLRGSLTINGGEFSILGGDDLAYFAFAGPCSLAMNGGILDFTERALYIEDEYAFTYSLSGQAMIRVNGSLLVARTDFNASNWVFDLYGSLGGSMHITNGSSLYDLVFTKDCPSYQTTNLPVTNNFTINTTGLLNMTGDIVCGGAIDLQAGTLDLNDRALLSHGDIHCQGTLHLDGGAELMIGDGSGLYINSGGRLEILGTTTMPSLVTRYGLGYHALVLAGGSTAAVSGTVFEYTDANGVTVEEGCLIDPSLCFTRCTFRDGEPGGRLLRINNSQHLIVEGASFPTDVGLDAVNVDKELPQGSVYFDNWSGSFGGESFDGDVYGRINWEGGDLPAVFDLTIGFAPIPGYILLDWTYPISGLVFMIYGSDAPEGPFAQIGGSSSTDWMGAATALFKFYRVTAYQP